MDLTKLLNNLQHNHFETSYFENKGEAAAYLNEKIDAKTVGLGDSLTLKALGLFNLLSTHNQVVDVRHNPVRTAEGFVEHAKKSLLTQVFLLSANAVAETGEIVNMDGIGNRISASLFGHEKVYYVIGINKICPDLNQALWRVRNIAAPQNAKRHHLKTPCAAQGDRCYNCSSPERICNGLLIEYKKMNNLETEVVIIGEELGL